ncbi:5470_t:CDS:2, partial [Dentiscutata heterogama]
SILADESHERLMDSPFKRQIKKGVLGNIYNGKVWQEFLDEQGQPFFVEDKTDFQIGLALNLDWYTPYSRVKRSCAPIYITILNFSRHIRYRSENLILASIIPGPKEPDTSQLQNYLQLIINELKQLWSGQLFKTTLYPIGHMFRCALIQIACDIPAARYRTSFAFLKTCMQQICFSGSSKLDYSNYIQDDPSLTNAEHRRIAFQYKISTSKRIVQYAWINEDSPKLSIKNLYKIQNLIDATLLPVNMGCVNFKITSGFDALIADQWKTWILIQLTQKIITEAEIEVDYIAMMAFLQYVEQIYGKHFCSPNIHLHKHLQKCMLDYGP